MRIDVISTYRSGTYDSATRASGSAKAGAAEAATRARGRIVETRMTVTVDTKIWSVRVL